MNYVFTSTPSLPSNDIRNQLSIKPGSDFENNLNNLISEVESIAKPKSIYRISYINKREANTVTVENTTFHSSVMSANLDNIGRVFPYVATCGTEVDEIPLEQDDILKIYWLNIIKLALLHISLEHLRQTLRTRFQMENISAMNPGSGDSSVWPIEEQQSLFSLFGDATTVFQEIGVHLMPSFLMVPEMSVSGILFPSENSYYNCQLCQREDCPGRRAHFDVELWDSIQSNQS